MDVLILYYSKEGNTEALANAVAEGVKKVEKANAVVKRVDRATVQDLVSCAAVAFGSPNYFGYMSGIMKDFFDRAFPELGEMPGQKTEGKIHGKFAAAFTSGGSPENTALKSIEGVFPAFGLKKAADGVASQRDSAEKGMAACRKLGEALAKAAAKRS